MKISLNELLEMDACAKGIERFIKQTSANISESIDVASLVGGINTYGDLLWLAGKKLTKERIVRFACDCALININKIEPYCYGNCFSAILEFLYNPSANNVGIDSLIKTVTNNIANNNVTAAATVVIDTVDVAHAAYVSKLNDNVAFYTAYVACNTNANTAVNNLLIEMFNEHQ